MTCPHDETADIVDPPEDDDFVDPQLEPEEEDLRP